MIDLDRIALEAIPDGTFGGPRPTLPPAVRLRRRGLPPTDPETALEHLAALAEAVGETRLAALALAAPAREDAA